jgi:hypothetical protein
LSNEKSDRQARSRFSLDPVAPIVMREKPGRTRLVRRWLVGPDRVELMGEGKQWSARVFRADWGGANLDVDGRFGDEAEAIRGALILSARARSFGVSRAAWGGRSSESGRSEGLGEYYCVTASR